MRYLIFALVVFVFLSCNDHEDPVKQNPNQINSIEVVSIVPAQNLKLDETSIISANIKYTIDPKEKSDYGFKIIIMFTEAVDTTKSYSFQPNSIELTSYSGTVKLDHDLTKEWSYDTKHPIQCHFNLVRGTSLTTHEILAKSSIINYTE